MKIAVLIAISDNSSGYGYLMGAAIGLFIFVYLVYALFKPEKF